jgi:hypothetical protein
MAAVHEQYTEEMRDRFGYLATWLPNVGLRLGDVGILKRDRFDAVTDLKRLGITFNTQFSDESTDLEYTSTDGVELSFKTAAEALGQGQGLAKANAVISVLFKHANAVMFVASKCRSSSIINRQDLGEQIIARHQNRQWLLKYVVVTELVTADTATVLISNSAGARIEFTVDTNLSFSSFDLADASGSLRMSHTTGIGTKIVAANGLTPLFRASGLRRRLASIDFGMRSGSDGTRETLSSSISSPLIGSGSIGEDIVSESLTSAEASGGSYPPPVTHYLFTDVDYSDVEVQ